VGSGILTKNEYQDGKPVLMREPKVFFIYDNAGEPVGINLFIGKRPSAFGNSTGGKQMLKWIQAGGGARLVMLVLHDDPVREYAYGHRRWSTRREGCYPYASALRRGQVQGLECDQHEE